MDRFAEERPLQPVWAAIVFADVVDSVGLIQADERGMVERIRHFLASIARSVVPAFGGQVLERQGDGLLLRFADAGAALRCAVAMQAHRAGDTPASHNPARDVRLRVAVHAGEVLTDGSALYGAAINLAARLLTVATAGDIVFTHDVHARAAAQLSGPAPHDMGLCYLKHWREPVHLWRLQSPEGGASAVRDEREPDWRARLAVLPFSMQGVVSAPQGLQDFLVDTLIAGLSRHPGLLVTSRLSAVSAALAALAPAAVAERLGVRYLVTGSSWLMGQRLGLVVHLLDARADEMLWTERVSGDLAELLQPDSALVGGLVRGCAAALLQSQVREALTTPLPQLDSHALMTGAVALMHRAAAADLRRSEVMLHAVIERHRNIASPKAWLAKWHVLSAVQGLDERGDALTHAIDMADRALDLEPSGALALSVKGHALCHQGARVDEAQRLLDDAVDANPSEPMAWLYRSVWHQMWGDGPLAVADAQHAIGLSPLDPQLTYFEMMLGNSHLANHDLERALPVCQSAVLKNNKHLPALRGLLLAQFESGDVSAARKSLATIRALAPQMTVTSFLGSTQASPLRRRVARAMQSLGLPDH